MGKDNDFLSICRKMDEAFYSVEMFLNGTFPASRLPSFDFSDGLRRLMKLVLEFENRTPANMNRMKQYLELCWLYQESFEKGVHYVYPAGYEEYEDCPFGPTGVAPEIKINWEGLNEPEKGVFDDLWRQFKSIGEDCSYLQGNEEEIFNQPSERLGFFSCVNYEDSRCLNCFVSRYVVAPPTITSVLSMGSCSQLEVKPKPAPGEEFTFGGLFKHPEVIPNLKKLLIANEVLHEDGTWKGLTNHKSELVALIEVLRERGYLFKLDATNTGKLFSDYFKHKISVRHLTNPASHAEIEEYKRIIPADPKQLLPSNSRKPN